jgi:riboflavin synthase
LFTGIVEELGEVTALDLRTESATLTIRGPQVVRDANHGVSISVNGVCLTVVRHDDADFSVDVMAETLRRSSLGDLTVGAPVNLERAMAAGGRFGGHIVQGHVDGTATVVQRTPGENWEVVRFSLPADLARYVVAKGSITVDGVSLTVSDLGGTDLGGTDLGSADLGGAAEDSWFEVSLIPTTLSHTTLGHKNPGAIVNLEVDVLAKYVERLLQSGDR